MNKLKEYLLSSDSVLVVYIMMGLRCLFIEPGIGFALSVISFSSLIAYKKYLDSKKVPDINSELRAEIDAMRTSVTGLMIKNSVKPGNMQQEIKRFF